MKVTYTPKNKVEKKQLVISVPLEFADRVDVAWRVNFDCKSRKDYIVKAICEKLDRDESAESSAVKQEN